MSIDPQTQSAFITCLPAEIRNAIYLELWRSAGLRQHIVWHGEGGDDGRHFCRWRCEAEFEVDDELQRLGESARRRHNVSLGARMAKLPDPETIALCRRLQSPWMNHWACGERAEREHGLDAVRGFTTSEIRCWKKSKGAGERGPSWSPYLPMLLSCRLM